MQGVGQFAKQGNKFLCFNQFRTVFIKQENNTKYCIGLEP